MVGFGDAGIEALVSAIRVIVSQSVSYFMSIS